MNTTMIICTAFVILLVIFYVLIKRFEIIICNEVCTILCDTISYIDQLCDINNKALSSWQKYHIKYALNGEKSYGLDKKILDEISYHKQEIEQFTIDQLSYVPTVLKSIILHKHKLSTQEIQKALMIPEILKKELITNLNYLVNQLNMETKIPASWIFTENILKCF